MRSNERGTTTTREWPQWARSPLAGAESKTTPSRLDSKWIASEAENNGLGEAVEVEAEKEIVGTKAEE